MNIFEEVALDQPVEQILPQSNVKVPNKFPSITSVPYRIAIIGEAPGRDEELQGTPFVGMSGKLLTGLLSRAKINGVSILREACFIGNICQIRPPDNDITTFSREGEQIQDGLAILSQDLNEFKPHVCLLLGKTALWAAAGHDKIGDYRGSLFVSDKVGPFLGRKCIVSYHPAAILRQYDWIAYLLFDILKAYREATSPELVLPQRDLIINPTAQQVVDFLDSLSSVEVGTDIEGYWNNLQCCSFADSENHAMIVPFQNLDGTSYWKTEDEEFAVWQTFVNCLSNPKVSKIWQNGLYDRFVLQYGYNITVCGNHNDIMLAWWERFCELEKGLGVQASIVTNEPYYKFERKSSNKEDFYRYCCKDGCLTKEIKDKVVPKLDPKQLNHYQLNVALLNPILYMELRGIRYDKALAQKRLEEINIHIYRHQAKLDALAGVGCGVVSSVLDSLSKGSGRPNIFDSFTEDDVATTTAPITKESLKAKVKAVCCYKRDGETPKKEFAEDFYRVMVILNNRAPLTDVDIGYINTVCGWGINVKGADYKTLLYDTLKLPKQYNTDPKTKKKSLTTDNDALLNLQKKGNIPAVELGINIMELRTREQMLHIKSDPDGRIRCGYNLVGTVTGRTTCYTSPTGSGYALQTLPDSYLGLPEGHPLRTGMRDLCQADNGCYMFQCDLKGSDGWTIGAHLSVLGDPSMLDDLRFGIKPAARICYMLRHGNFSLNGKSREEVKELLKEIKKEEWDYFACKIGIWGQCYLMGPDLLNAEILSESYGRMSLSRSEIKDFQNATFTAYDVRRWHRSMEDKLVKNPRIRAASGHERRFWSRPQDRLGKALAHEPQANTTYATNLAAWRLWTDYENRITLSWRTSLKIEPLHQVHDALIGQFKKSDTTWAIKRIKTYFNNEIVIAGIPITIPFDGQYGDSWGNLEVGKI